MHIEKAIRKFQDATLLVQKFNDFHYRINGEFDFWVNASDRPCVWHDRLTEDRGEVWPWLLFKFVMRRLKGPRPEVNKSVFVSRLMETGFTRKDAEKAWEVKP